MEPNNSAPRILPRFAKLFAAAIAVPLAVHAALDTAKIDSLTGLKGTWNEAEKVHKVTQPRNDLPIAIDGWTMPPFMGLTSWAAFTEGGKAEVMLAGDLVLFEDEVNPVMSAAFDAGLSVTALHNHFFFDQPRIYFMHIGGEGMLEQMAKGVRAALAKQKEIRAAQPQPAKVFGSAFAPTRNAITGATINSALGTKGQANNGMFKVVVGREVKMPCGCMMAKEMGVNTWASFAGTDDNAVVDGDFAVLEDELQPVLKSLRAQSINIVAIHHHMTHEQPRMLFLHYWGRGSVDALSRGLKQTLDAQKAVAAQQHQQKEAKP
ncbi:MAG: DUF1259 domain-containing protein [Verrucomicrobia bacterium]|nr:DUF1259 domain-containing protein [Verrucomicrobiota bacterium]